MLTPEILSGEGEILLLTAGDAEHGKRADAALAGLCDLSRSALARLMDEGSVTRRGEILTKKSTLAAGTKCRSSCRRPFPAKHSRRKSRWISSTRTRISS